MFSQEPPTVSLALDSESPLSSSNGSDAVKINEVSCTARNSVSGAIYIFFSIIQKIFKIITP